MAVPVIQQIVILAVTIWQLLGVLVITLVASVVAVVLTIRRVIQFDQTLTVTLREQAKVKRALTPRRAVPE